MGKKEKQPWNPFPLAVLNVEGLSRGAKHVLTVLAARSNWKGETCVGHRRLTKDCASSKQYVTDGLNELYAKGIVKAAVRGRKKNQADWKTISKSVLQGRTATECSPTGRDCNEEMKSYPVGLISPSQQECISKCNPTQQGETLQISPAPNLADENLADFSVSQSVGPETVAQDQKQETPEESELESESRKELEALADTIGCRTDIPLALGNPYFHSGHLADMLRIAEALRRRNRSEHWFAQLVYWAKGITDPKDREAQFWKRRLQTGDKAIAKLAEFLETGTIAEQFDVVLQSRHVNCLTAVIGERNDLLFRDGAWMEEYMKTDAYKALAAKAGLAAEEA